MKKINVIGFVAILACAVALAFYRLTGMTAHIIVSIAALVVMLICMIAGRKSWKKPAVEILYRAFYLIALISGFVMKSGSAPDALAIVHRIAAALFAVLFIAASVIAWKPSKK